MKFAQHLRNLTLLSTALAASAAFATGLNASHGSVSQEVWFGPEPVVVGQPLSRAEVLADLQLWKQAGLPTSTGEQSVYNDPAYAARLAQYEQLRSSAQAGTATATARRTLTRAEVLADLALWKQAGLQSHVLGEGDHSSAPNYAARLQHYQQLRQGSTMAGAAPQGETHTQ